MLSANNNVSWTKKHSLKSKWNILFDKSPEWISFKPQLGLRVYPCYSCKNMFSSKLTFQDHINRRVVIIKYKCTDCTNTFTFYNRCSFLLHARKHFSLAKGRVNLANVDIHLLPVDLAGFARHESIPFLYDEEEEFTDGSVYVNCQFYTPDDTEAGKQIITLRPFNLVFHYSEGTTNVLLVLKQISLNVPICEFITQQTRPTENRSVNGSVTTEQITNGHVEPEIKQEVEEQEEFTMPVISKIESLNNEGGSHQQCPECSVLQETPMVTHFLGKNRPLDDTLICFVCKYVAPTKCSLKAHIRTHENAAPHVCPECGKIFTGSVLLNTHMEEVCFHLSKNVRFRCPAQKCGKLFLLPNTYASHFSHHLQGITRCSACNITFLNDLDFTEHAKTHDSCTFIRTYNCMVCKNSVTLSHKESSDHINWHLQDRERCVYIYTCKHCKSYFRSTGTFDVHRQRCHKSEKGQPLLQVSNCQFCGQRIQFREKDSFKTCVNCKQINQVNRFNNGLEKKSGCVLCKEEITPEETKSHAKVCKYNNPIVNIQSLSESKDDETSSSDKISASNSDASNLDSSNDSGRTEDTPKTKKRKRPLTSTPKMKKVATEETVDLQAEKPISFDGTYYCKLCDYKNTERSEFHGHIVSHRDVSTAYQCMECGECFVVKPSLVKHLAHFHKITDPDRYFADNNCCDKGAIEELENNLKLVPGEHRGPVKENQCSVCLEQFEDSLSLDKHFRIHGMAFLLKKTK